MHDGPPGRAFATRQKLSRVACAAARHCAPPFCRSFLPLLLPPETETMAGAGASLCYAAAVLAIVLVVLLLLRAPSRKHAMSTYLLGETPLEAELGGEPAWAFGARSAGDGSLD